MPPATFAIMANITVAAMFAAAFLAIARLNPGFGRIGWFAISYAVGIVTPLAELLLWLTGRPLPFMLFSYAGLFAGLGLMIPALAIYYRHPPPWRLYAAVVAAGLLIRAAIWGGQRDYLPYELAYQGPYALVAGLSAWMVWRASRRTPLDLALAGAFVLVALHFAAKPFVAAFVGSGANATDYARSTYAVISQASTGILLTAAGLMLMLHVLQNVIAQGRQEADTDTLTGLANRRGLLAAFETARLRAERQGKPLSVLIFDIDRFKQVNDRWGHEAGDRVLRAVARALDGNLPPHGMLARFGGEEFVAILPQHDLALARLTGEALRLSVETLAEDDTPGVTISCGITDVDARDNAFGDALQRADRALYQAKAEGRNRCVAIPAAPATAPLLREA